MLKKRRNIICKNKNVERYGASSALYDTFILKSCLFWGKRSAAARPGVRFTSISLDSVSAGQSHSQQNTALYGDGSYGTRARQARKLI